MRSSKMRVFSLHVDRDFFHMNTIQYNIRLLHRSQTATTSNMKQMEHEIQLPNSGNEGIEERILN